MIPKPEYLRFDLTGRIQDKTLRNLRFPRLNQKNFLPKHPLGPQVRKYSMVLSSEFSTI